MADESLLEDALAYLERGWSVVPAHYIESVEGGVRRCSCRQTSCTAPGKHPNLRWQVYTSRLPTPGELRNWWQRRPDANIAIVTGPISNLVVVDIDPRHGGDEMWRGIEETYGNANTLTAYTASGGRHLYFEHPGEYVKGLVGVAQGIDIRADGNIVIAPPSRSYRERREGGYSAVEYEWEDEDVEIAPMPEFIATLIEEAERREPGSTTTHKALDWKAVLDGDAECPEGMRNDMMTAIAGHYLGRGFSHDETERQCLAINKLQFRPPLDEREVLSVVGSVVKMEQAKLAGQTAARRLMRQTADTADQLSGEEALQAATALWNDTKVPAVTDWYMLRSGDGNEYFLVTPEAEVSLGSDLLKYDAVRRALFNDLAILAPIDKGFRENWLNRAHALRRLAREDILEPIQAGERLKAWVSEYVAHRIPRLNVDPIQRRDALANGPILIRARASDEPHLVLRLKHFTQWVSFEDIYMTDREMQKVMRRAGWTSSTVRTGEDRQVMRVLRDPEPYDGEFVDDATEDEDA